MEYGTGSIKALYIEMSIAVLLLLILAIGISATARDVGPYIGDDYTPDQGTTGDPITFKVNVEGCLPNLLTEVQYWFGDGPKELFSMPDDGGPWIWQGTMVLRDSPGTMTYRFRATDGTGDWRYANNQTLEIVDNDPPVLVSDSSPKYTAPGATIRFDMDVVDNDEVVVAWLTVWFDDEEPTRLNLVRGDSYIQEVDVPEEGVSKLTYVVEAIDPTGNALRTEERTIDVIIERTMPVFGLDLTPTEGTTGDPLEFSVRVTSKIEMAEVRVRYRFGSTPSLNETMDGKYFFKRSLMVPFDSSDDLTYSFFAIDGMGTVNSTPWKSVVITDDDPPVAMTDGFLEVWNHDIVPLDGTGSHDNVDIDTHIWTFICDGEIHVIHGERPEFEFHEQGYYDILLIVRDSEGNEGRATLFVNVIDDSTSNNLGYHPPSSTSVPVMLLAILVAVLGMAGWVWVYHQRSQQREPFELRLKRID
jgi:hypothetical protein